LPGHVRKDCKNPKNKYSKPKINMVKPSEPNICSLLTTTAIVGGVEMKVGIDSGASTSIMSRDAAERFGIPVYPSLIEVENVHGTSTKIDGVTAPLEVIVHGVAYYVCCNST
jgi:hypothetical protein